MDAPRSALPTIVALLFLGAATACGPHEAAAIHDSAAIRDVGSLEGARAVGNNGPGGQSAQRSKADADRALTDSVRAQLQVMPTMNARQLTAILPTHIRMVAILLSRLMHGRPTGVHPTSERTATIDSVRVDLARLPAMTAQQLSRVMPAHLERVPRIVRD